MKIPFFQKKKAEQSDSDTVQNMITGEISFKDPLLYPRGSMFTAYNPDVLVMKKGGLPVYKKMRRDEQVKSCQWIKRLAVLCSGWCVQPASDDPLDVEVAEFCEDVLKRLKGTLEDKIKEILSGMDFGFSITEKIWAYMDEGDFRGKIGLKALKTRDPESWDFDSDEFGNLRPKGLLQLNGQYRYDPRKFVVYSHNKEFDNWYGTSDLQSAYRSWWSKDIITKFWNVYLEKFSIGIPRLKPTEGHTINEPMYTNLKNAVFNLQSMSALAWNVDGIDVDILEAKRRGTGEFDVAINYHDRGIARALLMPSGLGFSDEKIGGSYARSQTHFDLWMIIMEDLRKTSEETIMQEQIIRELVDYNYTVKEYPQFKFNPLDDPEKMDLAKLWLDALKGKAVHGDADDENHFRAIIQFPEKDRDDLEAEIEEEKKKKAMFPPPVPPGKQPDDYPDEDEEKRKAGGEFGARWHRPLTKYEKRVDFKAVQKNLDDVEEKAVRDLTDILIRQRDKLLASIEKNADRIDQKWINSLSLMYGVEFQSTVREMSRVVYEIGRQSAIGEVSRSKEGRYHSYIAKFPPKETIKALEQNSFWIKNVVYDGLTKNIQSTLINMVDTGENVSETMVKIRGLYDPYIGDTQKVIDQKQIEPYRIETLIRTNSTKAFNRGKMVEFTDPALDGYVRAVQLSAILDERTTDICRNADQTIIMLDDPNTKRLTPPLHHQCRTIVVPVTENDGEFTPSTQLELEVLKQQMPADFGGNADKGKIDVGTLKALPANKVVQVGKKN